MSTLLALALSAVSSASATPVNVGADAVSWAALFERYNTPANNDYGSPSALTWVYDPANPTATVATAYVKCGAFAAKEFIIGGGLTEDDVEDLTTSKSPEAALWYDAIVADTTVNDLSLFEVTMDELERGDLLVAKYTSGEDSGHVMLVSTVRSTTRGHDLALVPASPADSTDDKWLVVIYDSTKSPHGSNPSTNAKTMGVLRDSRNADTDAGGVEDKGVGVGTVVVYTDADDGTITGWRWSYNGTYYPPSSRPLVAGRLTIEE